MSAIGYTCNFTILTMFYAIKPPSQLTQTKVYHCNASSIYKSDIQELFGTFGDNYISCAIN